MRGVEAGVRNQQSAEAVPLRVDTRNRLKKAARSPFSPSSSRLNNSKSRRSWIVTTCLDRSPATRLMPIHIVVSRNFRTSKSISDKLLERNRQKAGRLLVLLRMAIEIVLSPGSDAELSGHLASLYDPEIRNLPAIAQPSRVLLASCSASEQITAISDYLQESGLDGLRLVL